jgi:hypothetical protein
VIEQETVWWDKNCEGVVSIGLTAALRREGSRSEGYRRKRMNVDGWRCTRLDRRGGKKT